MRADETLPQDVQAASIWFLEEKELYATVKPYSLAFTPAIDIPRENIVRYEVPVDISDMRPNEDRFTLDENGFVVIKFPNEHTIKDWDNDKEVEEVHYPVVISQIERVFPGARCIPLNHKVRKRDPGFPLSTGQDYAYGQPLRAAHVDMTRSSAEQMIQECVTEPELSNVFNGRYFVANLWHPIKGPNQDWPLALCDLSSLNPDQDLEVADYVSPTSSREHCMVYARNAHRWWYLSNQKTTESFLFRQHDSSKGKTSGVPHAAFLNPYSEQETPRESLECILLVYYP